jgi:hypothetical protein
VAVPFIWQTGQQGFRYAKVCWKDAVTEASTKGLYQLDGGAHNSKMLRARGSFYAIDRNSPTREWLEEEDILEVPGRRGARLQDEWDGLSPGQELEPWSTPAWKRRPRLTWPPEHARGGVEPKGRRFFSATDDPGLTENERWQPGRCIAEKDCGRVLDRPNTRVFRIGDTVAVTEVGNPGLHRDSWRLPESSITRYFVATVLEVDAKQRYYWDPHCNGLLLDEGAGYRVHREHSWIREITRADGTTWEPDMSPMEVEATCDPEQGGGQSQDSDTGYSGIAPKEKTWREITNTDL